MRLSQEPLGMPEGTLLGGDDRSLLILTFFEKMQRNVLESRGFPKKSKENSPLSYPHFLAKKIKMTNIFGGGGRWHLYENFLGGRNFCKRPSKNNIGFQM